MILPFASLAPIELITVSGALFVSSSFRNSEHPADEKTVNAANARHINLKINPFFIELPPSIYPDLQNTGSVLYVRIIAGFILKIQVRSA